MFESDQDAILFLESEDFKITHNFFWIAPAEPLTEKQNQAITYLIQEWDFGGLVEGK